MKGGQGHYALITPAVIWSAIWIMMAAFVELRLSGPSVIHQSKLS